MKKYGLLLGLSLFSVIAFSAPPHLIHVTVQSPSASLPANMTAMIPGLYVHYEEHKFQLVIFNNAVKAGETVSQSLYVPANAQWIKPVITYVDKTGSQHYWYCQETVNISELINASQPNRLMVKTEGTTTEAMKMDTTQTQSCSYQIKAGN